ncbi:group II intron reverse transcriptase/maturase [Parasutterella secunda]|uniref:group II intron reverse transcriptase/maturase n=1 Tax=Parasutterella secunda TaxID=626947 RepID=UPI0025A3C05B|nr:group II intron reverse transcriptase/maturase [Parasutterella secunda]MDM8218750.1 group II intron reverse transcriptase/maturase [Parasutterella secunda]
MVTLEAILNRNNLNRAWKQVVKNKGSAGEDGMKVENLLPYLREHGPELVQSVKDGSYKPQPVLRVLIPKEEKGQFRPLGIPTVIDRLIQQAVQQKLSEEYEEVFLDSSHGFRPNRSCQTALKQSLTYANEGYRWVVDLDLAKFFDTVNHSKLLQLLSDRIKDGRVISLIHKFLRAPIKEGDKITRNSIGTPQGGPISPTLANVVLHELDKELARRGHKSVRYADDMMIFCRSRKAAERTLARIKPFIEKKLFLQLNEQKTKIRYITSADVKFLGFGFWTAKDGEIKARPHQKSKDKCRAKLKELTSRSRGQSLDKFREKLAEFIRGWVNYFRTTSMHVFVRQTDEWLRRRIRQIYWKQWKKPRTRHRALVKLGLLASRAREFANTRKSYWHVANSYILSMTLKNDFLKQRGWVCLNDIYRSGRVSC